MIWKCGTFSKLSTSYQRTVALAILNAKLTWPLQQTFGKWNDHLGVRFPLQQACSMHFEEPSNRGGKINIKTWSFLATSEKVKTKICLKKTAHSLLWWGFVGIPDPPKPAWYFSFGMDISILLQGNLQQKLKKSSVASCLDQVRTVRHAFVDAWGNGSWRCNCLWLRQAFHYGNIDTDTWFTCISVYIYKI